MGFATADISEMHEEAGALQKRVSANDLRMVSAAFGFASLALATQLLSSAGSHRFAAWAFSALGALVSLVVFLGARPISRTVLRGDVCVALGLCWLVGLGVVAYLDEALRGAVAFVAIFPLFAAACTSSSAGLAVCGAGTIAVELLVASWLNGTGGHPSGSKEVFFALFVSAGAVLLAAANLSQRLRLERGLSDASLRLSHLSGQDPLTGCHDRRGFAERLRAEVRRAERYSQPLSLALLDIDGLERVNSSRGRAAGDELLASIALMFRGWTRSSDVVARVGDDEFALLMPHTEPGAAVVHMEHLKEKCGAIPDTLQGVTLSIGVAALDEVRPRAEQIRRDAQSALLEAKRIGGDAIKVFATSDRTGATAFRSRDACRMAEPLGSPDGKEEEVPVRTIG